MSDRENACSMEQPVSVVLFCPGPGCGAPVVSCDTGVRTRAGPEGGSHCSQVTPATGDGAGAVTKLGSIAATEVAGTGTGSTGATNATRAPGSRSSVTMGGPPSGTSQCSGQAA